MSTGAVRFGRQLRSQKSAGGRRAQTQAGAPGWYLTDVGRVLIRFPLDPRLSRALLEARRLGVLRQTLMVAAMMSLENLFQVGARRRAPSDAAHAEDEVDLMPAQQRRAGSESFCAPSGDHLTLLNVFRAYVRAGSRRQSPGGRAAFLKRFALDARALRQAAKIHRQISRIAARSLADIDALRLASSSSFEPDEKDANETDADAAGTQTPSGRRLTPERESELVLRSLLAGFWPQCARLAPLAAGESRSKVQRLYVPVRVGQSATSTSDAESSSPSASKRLRTMSTGGETALLPTHLKLHPSSALFQTCPPPLVLYTQLLITSAAFLKCASRIERRWLESSSAASMQLPSTNSSN